MSKLEQYLLLSLFLVFLLVFYRWLKRYLQRNEIQEAFPYVFPFEGDDTDIKRVIRIELPQKSPVRIELRSLVGHVVLHIFDGELSQGTHRHGMDLSSVEPGQYELRITFSNQVTTRSLSLK